MSFLKVQPQPPPPPPNQLLSSAAAAVRRRDVHGARSLHGSFVRRQNSRPPAFDVFNVRRLLVVKRHIVPHSAIRRMLVFSVILPHSNIYVSIFIFIVNGSNDKRYN